MCTLTYINNNGKRYFTSNRDEHINRPQALLPIEELNGDQLLLYPKDPIAGGTWFVTSNTGKVAILLNGAYTKHIDKKNYLKSRGLILLEIVKAQNAENYFEQTNLKETAPFTIVLYFNKQLLTCIWDGINKHITILNAALNYIWSSVTLYTNCVVMQRQYNFNSFINLAKLNSSTILNFHKQNHNDFENGLIIKRATGMQTFSVTQAVVTTNKINFIHENLHNNTKYQKQLPLQFQAEFQIC